MIYNEYLSTATPRRSLLDRRFGIERISFEMVLYALLFVLSIGLHIWQLDVKAMHHDESIHAWMSYKFFTGQGGFTCAGGATSSTYCYDPVYHGPSLYVLTLLSYFLFGAGDAQARLPMALAGIALVPMAWTLRSFIGRNGALLAALLLTISPSILYYTRFARHDALVLLWAMFMVVGLFKFVREGGAANLALATAGLALTWATHELVFILLFIGGVFFGLRMLWEWRPHVFTLVASVTVVVALVVIGLAATIRAGAAATALGRLLGPAMLLGAGALLLLPMSYAWEQRPVVLERFAHTWRNERTTYWIALGAFLAIFTLLFTTFFAYPIGFFDGWYRGIQYWFGSQHEYSRGGQPWFYYLMLLPIYDLLALVFGVVGVVWLMIAALRPATSTDLDLPAPTSESDLIENRSQGNGSEIDEHADSESTTHTATPIPLFVFFLGFWFIEALIGFSWAGEKMPWLLTHITLPATLVTAWVLGVLINRVPWRRLGDDWGWAVPLLTTVLALTVLVAAYAFSGSGQTTAELRTRLQGIVPLLFAGFSMFGLLTIANRIGGRVVVRLAALTIAAVLTLYGIRAMTLVVFRHPDVPIEPLVYTQTSPDVPVLVDQIEQLSINQSRSQRTAEDPTGSLSMPVVIDQGSAANGGEGSLAWPMQWYLRDHSVRWIDPTNNPSIGEDAGMVVLYTPHVTEAIRSQLEENFVQTSEGVFNWWFPEFGQAPARGYKSLGAEGVGAVLSWPFNPTNWPTLTKYMLYRELPMELDGRDMTVFVRRDLAPGAGAAASSEPIETLVPEATLPGAFNNARGLAVDAEGNMYVADALNHRIVVLDASGNEVRTIGSLGRDDGQLNEPSGVALDDDGNIYVADTWNGRIVKFASDGSFLAAWGSTDTPFGGPFTDSVTGQTIQRYATDTDGDPLLNEQNPLGFFGPRAVLVRDGRVYITDTGNSRVVVTDTDGNFIQQFGGFGQVLGQMSEPIGLGMDEQGRLFVGDTWNGRVQVFQPAADGTIDPTAVSAVQVRGWARDTYNDPYIVVAPDGTLYASQGARNTIAQYDPAQTLVRRIKTETGMDAPKGLALGVDGALYVVNSGQNAVLRFRP